jgi:hypothetical protein
MIFIPDVIPLHTEIVVQVRTYEQIHGPAIVWAIS